VAPMKYLSVCSGIEAATAAWHPLGWQAAAFSQFDSDHNYRGGPDFPSAVLAHHYPDVPNWGDMTKFKEWPDATVDLLVGGTPCQSFSLAGLRKGLDDPRGNLMLVYLAIARRYRPRWLVWENVAGVLSDQGNAFGTFLGGLAELGYGFAYRVLDAQYVRTQRFGRAVPQRRRRVFVVGYLGDWRRAAAVLFERESLLGNSPPRREAGKGAAPTLSARTKGGGGLGTDFDLDGGLFTASMNGHGQYDADLPTLRSSGADAGGSETLVASTGRVSHCLNAGGMGRLDYETETLVAHLKSGGGFDVADPVAGTLQHGKQSAGSATSQDANGGLLVPCTTVAYRTTGNDGCYETGDVTACLNTGSDPNQITLLQSWRVRRLTPLECERLQGFPDGYTDVPWRRKNWTPDGPRYKALGNSMAVNVMAWLGHRIKLADGIASAP